MDNQEQIAARIAKLLRFAEDKRGNEAEAANALELARELMAKYNLDIATVEANSKTKKGADRTKSQRAGKASYEYQRSLMEIICDVNFVYVHHVVETKKTGPSSWKHVYTGFKLIGRKANVVSAQTMFDYLDHTMNKLVLQLGMHFSSKDAIAWKTGCAYRLGERLKKRHDEAQAEQSRKAREAYAAAKAAGLTTGALVVMDDYAQAERDANEDYLNGLEPGTTARKRAEWEAGRDERAAEWRATMARINAQEAERRAKMTQAERDAEDKEKAKENARRQKRYQQESAKSVYNHRQFLAGVQAGDDIGLDPQVEARAKPAPARRLEEF